MSRFPLLIVMLLTLVCLTGCMHQPPMYQPGAYGQPMYGAPGGYNQPGTIYIPPSNAPPYTPGGTYDSDSKADDFDSNATDKDPRFFGSEGKVPDPKDPDTGFDRKQFDDDLKPNP